MSKVVCGANFRLLSPWAMQLLLQPTARMIYGFSDLIERHGRVDEGVTVGICRTNPLPLADDLALHLLNGAFNMHLIGFRLRSTMPQ